MPDLDSLTHLTQAELNQIATLKDLIPAKIKDGFEVKYQDWVEAWNHGRLVIHSAWQAFAECEEYESLVDYCKGYGKVIWPLLMDIIVSENTTLKEQANCLNLVRDLIFEGIDFLNEEYSLYIDLYVEIGKPYPDQPVITFQIYYYKKLLDKEYDNILKSIQDISDL
jgi:hypothetical protein